MICGKCEGNMQLEVFPSGELNESELIWVCDECGGWDWANSVTAKPRVEEEYPEEQTLSHETKKVRKTKKKSNG